ncbi:receptor-transporting protein 1-like [Lagenorhynchus albirostris]|uniref:receptor-transporting protein 1-like n=1 Tax=Lagenorhynchus albirostris TaxID=27610 RepID=UPI0028E95728|nr:receptor-transporting protein 1-like [Lagenorhynchus albirostris]
MGLQKQKHTETGTKSFFTQRQYCNDVTRYCMCSSTCKAQGDAAAEVLMLAFHCSWCWHTWQSPHVVILFHMYLDRAQRAGSVRMRVFKQLCYKCGTARLDESSMLEENIESLVDNLITSLREQRYGESGGQYRIHVASRQDNRRHRGELCEACQEGIMHWKPSEKLLEEDVTFSGASKPWAQEASGYNFSSLRWGLFWASLYLLIVYLQFSFRSSTFL